MQAKTINIPTKAFMAVPPQESKHSFRRDDAKNRGQRPFPVLRKSSRLSQVASFLSAFPSKLQARSACSRINVKEVLVSSHYFPHAQQRFQKVLLDHEKVRRRCAYYSD